MDKPLQMDDPHNIAHTMNKHYLTSVHEYKWPTLYHDAWELNEEKTTHLKTLILELTPTYDGDHPLNTPINDHEFHKNNDDSFKALPAPDTPDFESIIIGVFESKRPTKGNKPKIIDVA